jgi:hypothetical protein
VQQLSSIKTCRCRCCCLHTARVNQLSLLQQECWVWQAASTSSRCLPCHHKVQFPNKRRDAPALPCYSRLISRLVSIHDSPVLVTLPPLKSSQILFTAFGLLLSHGPLPLMRDCPADAAAAAASCCSVGGIVGAGHSTVSTIRSRSTTCKGSRVGSASGEPHSLRCCLCRAFARECGPPESS